MITEELLNKWSVLISACKAYYVDSIPTGMSDSEYDRLESLAANEGFFVRDYVFQTYLKGAKTKNSWIERIKKEKVDSMFSSMERLEQDTETKYYYDLKYDGSSLAIYIDPSTGVPKRVVTVGNLNLDDYGVDQTWKLLNFLPKRFPKGIVAIQAEALVDITRLVDSDPERARQKANGLINSKYCDAEINQLLTLRAFRYYTDSSNDGNIIKSMDYRDVLNSFETVYSMIDGHVLFSPAQVWTLDELRQMPRDYTETDRTITDTGVFLNDGWVVYDNHGVCQKALKYSGAGSETELIKTKVLSIQWNSQVSKGKDSWSANIIIDPVVIKGCTVKKPSAGSVGKVVKKNITPGAEVSIILANSTIPMVGEVFSPGNGDYQWPTCSCGYSMSSSDVYGSLLKCGNRMCTERLNRMRDYLSTLKNVFTDLDLNKFLVIDRFKWEDTGIDLVQLLNYIPNMEKENYYNYLFSYMKTDLQKKNLNLVWEASFNTLRENYENNLKL